MFEKANSQWSHDCFFFFLHQKDADYGEKAPHWNARKGGDKHIDSGILSESVSGSQYTTEQP